MGTRDIQTTQQLVQAPSPARLSEPLYAAIDMALKAGPQDECRLSRNGDRSDVFNCGKFWITAEPCCFHKQISERIFGANKPLHNRKRLAPSDLKPGNNNLRVKEYRTNNRYLKQHIGEYLKPAFMLTAHLLCQFCNDRGKLDDTVLRRMRHAA